MNRVEELEKRLNKKRKQNSKKGRLKGIKAIHAMTLKSPLSDIPSG